MHLITVDFETYYDKDYSLSKLTTEEYLRDPRFSVIGVSTKLDDAPAVWVTGPPAVILKHLHSLPWGNAMAVGHNMMFDGGILSWRCGIRPKALVDTMLMSRARYGIAERHSLAALSERCGAGVKGKEVENAKGLRRKDFSPEQMARYGAYCRSDVDLTHFCFMRMLREGFPREELQLIDVTLRMFTEPVIELDAAHLRKHLHAVRQRKEHLLAAAGVTDKKDLMSNNKFADMLRTYGVEPPTKVSPTTGKKTYAFAKTDEAFLELEDHPSLEVGALVSARLGNKSTLEETRTERFIGIAKRGPLPVPLYYYGAHTGRWSGRDKINLQNLPGRGPNAKQIKKSMCAPDGHVFVDCDSSQIEARVLAWLAEQEDMVEFFRRNNEEIAAGVPKGEMQFDPYKIMAARIFDVDVNDVDNTKRQVGKTVILGAGYGVGHLKLQGFLKTQAGVDVTENEARRIIDVYRTTNHHISGLWKAAQASIKQMAQGRSLQLGRPGVLRVDGSVPGIQLPNDMYIRYPGLTATPKEDFGYEYHYKGRGGAKTYIYGGKCTENITQALARVVVGEQMLMIAKRYRVVLTVHDSVVACVRKDEADEARGYIEACMRTVPEWAPGLPLNCESEVTNRYGA